MAFLKLREFSGVPFTEFDADNSIHLNADKVVAVKYADHATQIICAEHLSCFVKNPSEQVLKDLRAARRGT